MDEGFIQERIEEEEESTEIASSLTASIRARILGLGSGSLSGTVEGRDASGSVTGETRALHHYYVPLLETWLKEYEGEWFHDIDVLIDDIEGDYVERAARSKVASSVSEGDIIRISGDIELLDFATSLQFIDGMLNAIDKFDETIMEANQGTESEPSAAQSEAVREALTDDDESDLSGTTAAELFDITPAEVEAIRFMFDLFHEITPSEYEDMLVTRVFPPVGESKFSFWGLVQREKLDTNPVELLSKYETSKIPNCTILARVETITENPEDDGEDEENGDSDDFDFGTLHHFSDEIASNFGLKVSHPEISISPIVIYR